MRAEKETKEQQRARLALRLSAMAQRRQLERRQHNDWPQWTPRGAMRRNATRRNAMARRTDGQTNKRATKCSSIPYQLIMATRNEELDSSDFFIVLIK